MCNHDKLNTQITKPILFYKSIKLKKNLTFFLQIILPPYVKASMLEKGANPKRRWFIPSTDAVWHWVSLALVDTGTAGTSLQKIYTKC